MNQRSRGCRGSSSHLSVERRMSPHTDSNYRRDLQRFVAHCAATTSATGQRVDGQHVRTFAARRISPRLLARTHSTPLESRFAASSIILLREGAVKRQSRASTCDAPKAKKRLPATIDADQMARLLELPHRRRAERARQGDDGAVLFLRPAPCGTGRPRPARISISPIAPCACSAKAARRASCPWAATPSRHLTAWLPERTKLARSANVALFVGKHGSRIGPRRAGARRALGAPPGPRRARAPAHVPPLLRHAPAGIQPGPARRSGTARPRQHRDHADLHPP